jgi:hypothetical protein
MGFIGFGIYFCIEKSIDWVYGSYGPAVSGSTVDRSWEGGRSSPALSTPALRGAGLAVKAWGGRGRLRGAHRGRSWAARWWSHADDGEDWRRRSELDGRGLPSEEGRG